MSVVGAWGNRQFRYADPNNKLDSAIREILAGKAYPLPIRPPNYVFDTIVDVGANVGASALWFLSQNPRRLVCFEPSAENFAHLQSNLAGLPNVEAHQYGLFSRDVDVPLYRGKHQNMQNSVVRSVETTDVAETIKLRRATTAFAELGVDRISVLKIDTEGCEVPILADIAALLPRVDMIYAEYHSEQDRREIERTLTPQFVLGFANGKHPHRGVNLYLANRLVAAVPIYGALALKRPV